MNYTPIVLGVLALISAVATAFFIPWIKSKTTTEQQEQIKTTIRMLMGAAEVYFDSGEGAKKKEWVIEKLEEYGIDSKEVGNWIEGTYSQMKAEGVL